MPNTAIAKAKPPLTYERFIAALHDPDETAPVVSPRLFSQALRVDLQTLAQQAGVHRNTIARAPSSMTVQRFLRDALRVIKAGTDVSGGNVEQALYWYRTAPLAPFRYMTPEQLVAAGRTDALLEYVESLSAGALG